MSDTEDHVCLVCSDFEPQAWRKSLCRNCFHTLDEHSEELLANEAKAVAKEKVERAAGKGKETPGGKTESPKSSPKDAKAKPGIKEAPAGKESLKDMKKKLGADKDGEKSPVSKDLGKESAKPGAKPPAVGLKSKSSTSPSTTTSTSSTSSSSPSPTSSLKSSSKFTTSSSTTTTTTKTSSAASSASTTTTSTTSTSSTSSSQKHTKAKDFASKFESKISEAAKGKGASKPPTDLRPGSSSVAALTGKLLDEKTDSKSHDTKSVTPKTDSKTSVKKSEESKVSETLSKLSKSSAAKSIDDKDSKKDSSDSKDKKSSSLLTNKSEDKSLSGKSKAAPFGKDLLKSSKDSTKKDSPATPLGDKTTKTKDDSLKSKDSGVSDKSSSTAKVTAGKGIDSKNKKPDEEVTKISGKVSGSSDLSQSAKPSEGKEAKNASLASRDSKQADSAKVNKPGQLAKTTGKIADDKVGEGTPSAVASKGKDDATGKYLNNRGDASPAPDISKLERDKSSGESRDRGKGKGDKKEQEGSSKQDTSPSHSSSVGAKQASATSAPSPSPKPTTPTTPSSSSTDSKSSSPFFPSPKSAADKKPKDLKLDTGKEGKSLPSPLDKFKALEKTSEKSDTLSSVKSPSATSPQPKKDESKEKISDKTATGTSKVSKDGTSEKLAAELKEKEKELATVTKKLSEMEKKVKSMEEEKEQLKKESIKTQKEDTEKMLKELQSQLGKMEGQCTRLQKDNQSLIDKLHAQEASVKRDQECRGKNSDNVVLEEDLEAAEKELEDVKEENKDLQRQIMDMKNEMDEMYDHFRETEHDEFRELQKELDMTAKNCRILQFKLRKAERRNEQVEEDRMHYEEKLRMLQDQFDSADAKNHIRVLEEELRMAKEVSERLHDELDIVDDKKNKAMEENRHLTELLEHTDKRQFRMEMEIDKLRDMVNDLKQQLKEARGGNNKDSSPDRKPTLGAIGKQGSKEYDTSQLMRDLCDSMERENDLKDQLKFTEEEAKMMRRRVGEMDEENENLRLQLQKMSEKASKHKKKEKEKQKELEEERRQLEAHKAGLAIQTAQHGGVGGEFSTDVILVVGPEGSDVITCDESIPVSERKDSTDEDLMNVMQMRVQLEMLENELMTSHKKLDDMDLENENLQAEVKFLQERLAEKEKEASGSELPEPSTPNAYYEDKLKELTQEADELRWKLIEKDREVERLTVVQQTRQSRDHKKGDKLKKSKSLDTGTDPVVTDLRRKLEQAQMEIIKLKKELEVLNEQNEELRAENDEFQNRTPIPSVQADDAALENIELKDKIRKMEDESRAQVDKLKSLTESLQLLSRDSRTYTSIATSPTVPASLTQLEPPTGGSERPTGTLSIPGIPLLGPGTQTARAGTATANERTDSPTRDLRAQLLKLQGENEELRRIMGVWEGGGKGDKPAKLTDKPGTAKSVALSEPESSSVQETKKEASSTAETLLPKETNESKVKDLVAEDEVHAEKTDLVVATQADDPLKSEKTRNMDAEKEATATTSPSTTTVDPDGAAGKKTIEEDDRESSVLDEDDDDGGDDDDDDDGDDEGHAKSRRLSEDVPKIKSILLDYPDGKSKVTTSGSESRVELMEKILDMDEEIGDLLRIIRRREEESERLKRDMKSIRIQMKEVKDESRRTEMDLLQELDMMHDKNCVMSNLLDIINERAEAAEEELERRLHEETTHSPVRSASNVSQVSALSDTSMGSDEVFLNTHGAKEGVITRDWEAKLKGRIDSLERLLAEERQKVSMAEKKLLLAGIDTVSPSVSDDVKLRMREKELLQEELLKSQRHLHIATDQIQGLKERITILEEENERLRQDYAKLYDEIDKPLDKEDTQGQDESSATESDKTPENSIEADEPFVAKRISVIEAPKYRELKRLAEEDKEEEEEEEGESQQAKLAEELAKYKQKAKDLEYKVEEMNDIWRSKSAASEKERDELEIQLKQKVKELNLLEETIESLKLELRAKDKIITENDVALREKDHESSRLADVVKGHEEESKRHEQDRQTLLTQISQRDNAVRGLNETIRIRDERLKEKDDILFKLNTSIEDHKREMKNLGEKLQKMATCVHEKESEISVLRGQISSSSVLAKDTPRSCQTDAEKEGFRLKETLKKVQGELDRVVGDKRILETVLEKTRKALDDAMMNWNKERNELQREANILDEKVRMYEAYNAMNKDEAIDSLKSEAQMYFSEKEKLTCDLSAIQLKYEAAERQHKEQMAKLQAELAEKLRLLKSEVDNSSHMNTEVERLKRQAEMAYRLQQEQRVLKAEHLAMKVRYETRIDKMSKEHNKMLVTIEKLQRERSLDKQIIQGIQQNLSSVKDTYTEALLKWEEDKANLHRHVKEIEESRSHLEELQKHVRELREKTIDQDRLRTELINKFATDRASWEIEKANLNSKINQLDEQICSSSRQQERSKDIQVNMGLTWEKERREQRRILAEAHTLALDLQEQLKSRDEAFAHERKELIRQMEGDRLTWTKERREMEKKMMELDSMTRKVATLQKRVKELQDKAGNDYEKWQKEKMELLRCLAETRHAQTRDSKKMEDALSRLIRLRELGSMLTSQPKWDSLDEKPPDRPEHIDQIMVDYVKETWNQVSQVADDLTMITNPTHDEGAIKRISSSEIELLKDELTEMHPITDDVFVVADVTTSSQTTTTRIAEESSGTSRIAVDNKVISLIPDKPASSGFSEVVTKSSAHSIVVSPPNGSVSSPSVKPTTSPSSNTMPTPVILRPFDSASRRYDRPPSYTSGTRSAQSSRAATPEIADSGPVSADNTLQKRSGLPEPPPSIVIPHHRSFQPQFQQGRPLASALSSGQTSGKPRRPVTFTKSLSLDSGSVLDSRAEQSHMTPNLTSISASNTPTQPVTSAQVASYFSSPSVISPGSGNRMLTSRDMTGRASSSSPSRDRVSPRTARRKFFEASPAISSSSSHPAGYMSWPERRSVSPALHTRQQSLPNPDDVRREAEEEHDLVKSRLEPWGQHSAMKTSTSWDEQIISKIVGREEATAIATSPSSAATTTTATSSTDGEPSKGTKPTAAKEKRKFFKKAVSLDSTVGSSIAKAGVSAISAGAPSGFTPSEIFAAVKGKLKPVFKRKSGESGSKGQEPRSPSPLFIQTEVPDIHFASHPTTSLPAPEVDADKPEASGPAKGEESGSEVRSERSRDSGRGDVKRSKWRSKSADRAQQPVSARADVIRTTPGVWKFNETAV